MKKLFVFILFAFIFTGCTQSIYKWNGYDDAMYKFYKNPVEKEKFIEKLKNIIDSGEGTNTVPPGIYAEYGYLQYESSNYQEAIIYFQKEHDRWPESRIFISKMIRNAKMSLERENARKNENVNTSIDTEKRSSEKNL